MGVIINENHRNGHGLRSLLRSKDMNIILKQFILPMIIIIYIMMGVITYRWYMYDDPYANMAKEEGYILASFFWPVSLTFKVSHEIADKIFIKE
jgi:hypothetical protein